MSPISLSDLKNLSDAQFASAVGGLKKDAIISLLRQAVTALSTSTPSSNDGPGVISSLSESLTKLSSDISSLQSQMFSYSAAASRSVSSLPSHPAPSFTPALAPPALPHPPKQSIPSSTNRNRPRPDFGSSASCRLPAVPISLLPPPPRKAHIYVGRFAVSLSSSDVADHLRSSSLQFDDVISIPPRPDSPFLSFSVVCDQESHRALMNPDVWSEGVLIRYYRLSDDERKSFGLRPRRRDEPRRD